MGRYIYNSETDTIIDSLQEIDLTNEEIVDFLNYYYDNDFKLNSDKRYYKSMSDMYEDNFISLKKSIEILIKNYTDLSICESNERASIYVDVISDLENLFNRRG